jgi:hypothetical protein
LTNFDSTKFAIIGSLFSDLALLLIMLIGLLRLRCKGETFALGRTLWNQVRWWQFPLAVVLSNTLNVDLFVGFDLALVCHRRRDPFSSTSGDSLAPFLFAHLTSQVLSILNLNGSFLSLQSTKTGID